MKILIVGAGGREHALAWKIAQSPRADAIYSSVRAACGGKVIFAGNDLSKKENVLKFCKDKGIDFVVVGPEAPLADGMADLLRENGVPVFGPGRAGARLENSKAFSKNFLVNYNIPTSKAETYTDFASAKKAITEHALPVVVKADGLAAGKGVRICLTREDALTAVVDFMEKKIFGNAGDCVVVEEYLPGVEASVMAFVDGEHYLLLPVSRDHKRLYDKNQGPNTGGMGVYCPVPDVGEKELEFIKREVFDKVIAGLKKEKIDFCGIIYAGLMMTKNGPKVLEFNCRFGDPEAQAVLPLVKTDLLELLLACEQKKLAGMKLDVEDGACVCVVLASEGYPDKPLTGREITGLAQVNTAVFHAGTEVKDGKVLTKGGRVLGVTAVGENLRAARRKAYAEIEKIHFDGMQFRKDIGELQ
ncbi:MAG: phosphoribosylamine--glycine ligase [Elusimicrobia bacterium]|nr:phosphoribosylamine--glycine ligase [Elusimicrobiota bacterium]